ncbi:hypothetical protein GOP47_0012456 [Adiantum capillus-veneris]|uniref:Uncharacterized protein n=1 Tax=Adiantum capillus-veneris TaxID=13818 RepID=A0A9D4UR18_ADICA|nr:hypothetical protein GOP47_0012456 [Adiantum capillus-veneris]
MLPQGSPMVLQLAGFVKDNFQVVRGINDIRYWEKWVGIKGSRSSYENHISHVIEYWKKMVIELQKLYLPNAHVYECFWLLSEGTYYMMPLEMEEDSEFEGYEENNDHYFGSQNQSPKLICTID